MPNEDAQRNEETHSAFKDGLIVGGFTLLVVALVPLLAAMGLALQVAFVVIAPILVIGTVSFALLTQAEPIMDLVHGIELPTDVAFHRSHSWARRAARRCFVVGVDDLARRLIGHVSDVDMPEVGTRVERGQVVGVLRNGRRELPVVAPISGQVAQINPGLAKDPSSVAAAPYGKGWLLEVTPEKKPLKGLLRGESRLRWMQREVDRLATRLSPAPALALADGAAVDDDIGAFLDDATFQAVVADLVLSED